MNKNKLFFKKNAVLCYFVLTILITWGGIVSLVGVGGVLGTKNIPEAQMPVLYLVTLLGPSVAGILMTELLEGKKGLRALWSRMSKWRVSFSWYAFALLTAPLLISIVLFALSSTSPNYLPALTAPDSGMGLIMLGIFMGFAVGFFEELGWTGFAVPRLLEKFNTLGTGIITGLVWGLWHLPLFLGSINSSGDIPSGIYLFSLLFSFLPAYRVLMVHLYDRTKSLLLAMLMHAPLSASQLILIPADLSGKQLITYNMVFTASLWLIITIITSAFKKKPNVQNEQI